MTELNVVFSHGQESGPWGTKITAMVAALDELGCSSTSINYRGMPDPTARVRKLIAAGKNIHGPLLLIGSSMGGHVAVAAATELQPAGVFVLAPAFYMPGYEELTPPPPSCPLSIVHGWQDDVVPPQNSVRYAADCRATLHLLNGDHRLSANIQEINSLLCSFARAILDTVR